MRQKFGFGFPLVMLALLSAQVACAQVNTIRINEVFANNLSYSNSDGSLTDLVELYNSGGSAVDLGGCSLSDSNICCPRRFVFSNGTVMLPGEFLRIMCDSRFGTIDTNNGTIVPLPVASPPFGVKVPFGIKASGGNLYFYGPLPQDLITPIDRVEYGLQIPDFSIGHVIDGNGPWELTTPTLGRPNVPVALGSRSNIRINEWLVKGSPDYVELYNPANKPVSIGGMYISDTSTLVTKFRIPDLSFIAGGEMGGFVRFNCDGTNGTPKYPADETNFKLGDNEVLVLTDSDGLQNIDFIPNWLATHTSDVSAGRLPDGSANIVFFPKINDYETRSPGEPNFLIFPFTNSIVVSEVLSHTDPPLEDAIEFQNRAATNINISGWWLSNSRLRRKRYQIPGAAAILPGRFRVIYEGATNGVGFNSPTAPDPYTFNSAHGDNIVLSQVDASGNLTGYIVYEEFESAANGVSFGHYDTSVVAPVPDYKFVAMSGLTFGTIEATNVLEFRQGTGQSNTYPRVGPVVINEIMFAPAKTTFLTTNMTNTFDENPAEEYIELRNITSQSVPLYTIEYSGVARALITNYWKLQRALSFDFPLTNLAPNSFCVVVGFDPYTNAAALTNFRSRFGVSNDVPIFGPWIGQLNNGGDSIEFYRPDPVQQPPHPDAGFVPFIRIDKVNYRTSPPWPGGANLTGASLQRKNSLLFGNDPINWAADVPNPGRASVALQDTDGDGMPDAWEIANGFNPNNPGDAALDADGDGVANVAEYAGGTNPHDANSFLRLAEIVPYQGTNFAIRFLAYSNATYSVQFRNSLSEGSDWNRVGDVPSAPSNRVVEVPDLTAWKKSDRYYRVIAPAAN